MKLVFALAAAALVAGCSSGVEPKTLSNAECLGMADSLKTLKIGDEFPRVMQVMGQPSAAYRVVAPFGRTSDVAEYEVGSSACGRLVLDAPKSVQLVFDADGKLKHIGRTGFLGLQRATAVRIEPIPVRLGDYGNK